MLEARGFLFGSLMALYLNVPCIPVRKKGKLPGKVGQLEYNLEYGKVSIFIFGVHVLFQNHTRYYAWIYIYISKF